MATVWQNFQEFVGSDPFMDGYETVSGWVAGPDPGPGGGPSWDEYLDTEQYVNNVVDLDDYRSSDFPWEWIVGAGLVVVALYASGRAR